MDRTVKKVKRVTSPEHILLIDAIGRDVSSQPLSRYGTSGSQLHRRELVMAGYAQMRMGDEDTMRQYLSVGCTQAEIVDVLRSMAVGGKRVWVFGVGMRGLFDLLRIWEWIDNGEISLAPSRGQRGVPNLVCSDPPTIADCRVSGTSGRAWFLGVENYGVDGYADLGVHTEYALYSPTATEDCQDDCTDALRARLSALSKWVAWYYDLLASNDMGSWAITAAAQGWHTYRRKALSHDITIHDCVEAKSAERNSYYGGRCECLKLGMAKEAPIYHLDVNSMYVAAAQNLQSPYKLLGQSFTREVYNGDGYGTVAKVDLVVDQPLYPRRIAAQPDGSGEYGLQVGDVVYPTGRLTTWLCGPELNHAVKSGAVKYVHESYIYRCAQIFRDWTEFVWPLYVQARKHATPAIRHTMKKIMLGLYGRFGSRHHTWVERDDIHNDERWEWWQQYEGSPPEVVEYRTIAGVTSSYNGLSESLNAFCAIAAWVNSAARLDLAGLIMTAGGGNVYYYDTDSVWCNAAGLDNLRAYGLLDNDALGKLKVVATHDVVEFRGIKNYVADGRVTCAGLTGVRTVRDATPLDVELSGRTPPRSVEIERAVLDLRKYRHGVVSTENTVTPHICKDW